MSSLASAAPMARPVYLNGVLLGWCYHPRALAQALRDVHGGGTALRLATVRPPGR